MSIKNMRLKRRLSQEALALRLGVTRTAVTKWETGESSPRTAMLPEIAKVLRCSIDKLFD